MSIEKYNKHRKQSYVEFISKRICIYIYHIFKYYLRSDKYIIKKKFIENLGYEPNIDHPSSFQEQLQWLKIYDRKKWYPKCADKIEVKEFIKEILGTNKYNIPLLYQTSNYRDLKPENLPDAPFILKCNHDNNSWILIDDKKKFDWEKIRSFYRERLSYNFFWINREWPYKNIKPKVMIEAYLQPKDFCLKEYKFYCFNKEIKYIQYSELFNGKKKYRYLSPDFSQLPTSYKIGDMDILNKEIPCPKNSIEMINIVKLLSSKFEYYIRIDLFDVDDCIYIGEITFFDGAGYDYIVPEAFQNEISSHLDLY